MRNDFIKFRSVNKIFFIDPFFAFISLERNSTLRTKSTESGLEFIIQLNLLFDWIYTLQWFIVIFQYIQNKANFLFLKFNVEKDSNIRTNPFIILSQIYYYDSDDPTQLCFCFHTFQKFVQSRIYIEMTHYSSLFNTIVSWPCITSIQLCYMFLYAAYFLYFKGSFQAAIQFIIYRFK